MTNRFFNGSVIFIGEPGVGKTSLMVRLLDRNSFPKESKATEGININNWVFFDEEDENEINVSLTDFGGQEIFYTLYPLFFRNRSVYVYVHDARKETDIEFWLSQINQNSKDSSIIIVQNKIDAYPSSHLNQQYLKSKYPSIISFINTSAATSAGVNELRNSIIKAVKISPNYGVQIPTKWSRLISEVFELSKSQPYITFEDFEKISIAQGITESQSIRVLISYLHDIGIIFNFQNDIVLSSIILLDIDWLLKGIYFILSSQILSEEKGRISIDQINQILKDYSNYEQSIFIQVLLLFQLGYQLEGGSFIIPIALPSSQTLKEWNFDESYKFEYHFQTIPFGLIERFIVKNFDKIDINKTWRNGTVIKFEEGDALLVSDKFERRIKVWILGDNPKEILSFVSFEIERLLNSYVQVDFKKLIPCICETCLNNQKPYLYDFELLKKVLSRGKSSVECAISFSNVEIDRLLFNPSSSSEKIELPNEKKSSNVEYEWNNLNNLFFEFHYVAKKNDVFQLFYEQCKDINLMTINSSLHIVEFENSRAKIENELVNQKIKITIEGDFKEEILAILRHKIHGISNNYKIELNKFVKCNCIECLHESYYFDFDFLRKRELKGKDIVICEKSANDVSIMAILGRHKSDKDNSGIFIIQNQHNSNEMKIENQNIYGGNQQFADLIINNSQVLDETDSRFLQLIHENTSSPEEKKALVESLENVKSHDKPNEEKKKSGGLLRKFMDSIVTEGGKQIVKEIAENGAEYLQYIF